MGKKHVLVVQRLDLSSICNMMCVCATLDFARLCFIVTLMRIVWTAYARIEPPKKNSPRVPPVGQSGGKKNKAYGIPKRALIEITDTSRRPSDHAATGQPGQKENPTLSGRNKLEKQTTRSAM